MFYIFAVNFPFDNTCVSVDSLFMILHFCAEAADARGSGAGVSSDAGMGGCVWDGQPQDSREGWPVPADHRQARVFSCPAPAPAPAAACVPGGAGDRRCGRCAVSLLPAS